MDELLDVFPEFVTGTTIENRVCALSIISTPEEVRLSVPDDADEKKIEAVVTAHDPASLSKVEKAEAAKETRRVELRVKIAKVQDEKLTLPELREIVAALVEFLEV
jgi:hypothetical protein